MAYVKTGMNGDKGFTNNQIDQDNFFSKLKRPRQPEQFKLSHFGEELLRNPARV